MLSKKTSIFSGSQGGLLQSLPTEAYTTSKQLGG